MGVQKIYLIRHGETDANLKNIYQGTSLDPPLNNTGKSQKQRLAKFLGQNYKGIEKIITSPSVRAMETASAIAQEIWYRNGRAVNYEIENDLHEIDHGDWENKTVTEIKIKYPDLLDKWRNGDPSDIEFPNGEKVKDAIKRSFNVFCKILEANKDGDLIIVSHGGTNSIILGQIMGADNFRNIIQSNTCINIIERRENNNLKIVLMNGTFHLLQ